MAKRPSNTIPHLSALCLRRLLAALVLLLASPFSGAEQPLLKLVIPPLEETARPHSVYFPRLLELALSKTKTSHGPYTLEQFPVLSTTARYISDLKGGRNLDLIWSLARPTSDGHLIQIPVPLLRGLNDHRIFLIQTEDRQIFADINTIDQLRQLRAGQGQHWLDTEVLRANDLPVITSAHYELLFGMLEASRFDYFPRGLHEVWDEYQQHQDKGLFIEQTLMLHYPAEMYFFVNSKDRALADRIEAGLKLAIEDGSLDELFFSIPSFKRGYQEMLNPDRVVLELKHPTDPNL